MIRGIKRLGFVVRIVFLMWHTFNRREAVCVNCIETTISRKTFHSKCIPTYFVYGASHGIYGIVEILPYSIWGVSPLDVQHSYRKRIGEIPGPIGIPSGILPDRKNVRNGFRIHQPLAQHTWMREEDMIAIRLQLLNIYSKFSCLFS
jgi:hypothetical protein